MAFVALLDANVLYPAYLRDALLRLAEAVIVATKQTKPIVGNDADHNSFAAYGQGFAGTAR